MRGAGAEALLVGVLIVDACLVLALFRWLTLHPVPAFSRGSLRAAARTMVAPAARGERWRVRIAEIRRERPQFQYLPFLLIAGTLYLPAPLRLFGLDTGAIAFGPFREDGTSADFLATLWQVVAAAVGLTVAMVAFAFEAFIGTGQRQFGGSLWSYAKETRILIIIRLGVTALLLIGAVLLEVGLDAPAGWAAMWATAVAAATLLAVVWTIERTIRSLAPAELMAMRRHQLETVVRRALRSQLIGQAADIVLREGNGLPVERRYFAPPGGARIGADRSGRLRDVRVGTLARLAPRSTGPSAANLFTLVGLDGELDTNTELASVPVELSPRQRRRARRAFRIDHGRPREEADLLAQIERLHALAMAMIREHQLSEWREIGELYELILLELPRATARHGLPFEGAIAAPGTFGFGPMQRIERNLHDELDLALSVEDTDLVDAISYLPFSIAQSATGLGAGEVAASMLGLYPQMYLLAKEHAQ